MKDQLKKRENELLAIEQEEKEVLELIKAKEQLISALEDDINSLKCDLDEIRERYEVTLWVIERIKGIYDED